MGKFCGGGTFEQIGGVFDHIWRSPEHQMGMPRHDRTREDRASRPWREAGEARTDGLGLFAGENHGLADASAFRFLPSPGIM